jgi:hypothetical protein
LPQVNFNRVKNDLCRQVQARIEELAEAISGRNQQNLQSVLKLIETHELRRIEADNAQASPPLTIQNVQHHMAHFRELLNQNVKAAAPILRALSPSRRP